MDLVAPPFPVVLLSRCSSFTAAAVDCSRDESTDGQEVARVEEAVWTLWAYCLLHPPQTNTETKTKHKKQINNRKRHSHPTHTFFFPLCSLPCILSGE